MRLVTTAERGRIQLLDVPVPEVSDNDVLVRIRACGICGSDLTYVLLAGRPGYEDGDPMPLGHEPAGEVVEVGRAVTGFSVGDHVVINPMAAPTGVIGNGGSRGALADYLLVEDALDGVSLKKISADVPFTVAALNEPMAVARHFVNRAAPQPDEKVVLFGAGPIGLGATIWLKLRGVKHVVVVDVVPERLQRALAVGADAVIDSSTEDVSARLTEFHGQAANGLGEPRPGTDVYMDATGASPVLDTVISAAKWGARLTVVGVHKHPVTIDTTTMLTAELTYIPAMGYPTEIFEVTDELAAHWEKFQRLIGDVIGFDEVQRAFDLALTPGGSEKVVISFD